MSEEQPTEASRLPLLLMLGGGVFLVACVLYAIFGGGGDGGGDDEAALEVRCQFPSCRASSDPRLGRGFEGASVAVDPADQNHIVVTDANMTAGHCTWHTTFDRGKEWVDGTFQEPPGYTGCHINGAAGGHVPTGPGGVSFGSTGTIYATYGSAAQEQGTRESIILARSTDGGKTFNTSVASRPPGDDISYARPLMSVVPGPSGADRILMSFWLCNQNGRFCPGALFAKSDDGGSTWSQPLALHDVALGVRSPSEPLLLPDQSILVSYIADFDDGTATLHIAKSVDAGATFTSATIDRQNRLGDRYDPAKMAFDARTNAIYIVYSDQRTGQQQVFIRKSLDKGVTWSDPTGIAPDQSATSTGSSRTPSVAVAPNGRVDLVYYRTPAANTDNVFWAASVDGAVTFRSRQVNEQPIRRFEYNRAIGTWYPPDVFSLDDSAWVAWSDSKNAQAQDENTQDVFLRRMVPIGSDIPP
ncbi:MAG: sialidase family protein [Acidimicrobiales bacterium]